MWQIRKDRDNERSAYINNINYVYIPNQDV